MMSGGTLTRVMNQPLTMPAKRADGHCDQDRTFQWQTEILPAHAKDDSSQAEDRADGKIDPGCNDDEGHR